MGHQSYKLLLFPVSRRLNSCCYYIADSPTSIASSSPKFNRHSHRTSSSPPLNHLHHQDRKKIKDNPPPPPPNKSNRKGPISFSMHPISIAPSPSPTQGLLPPLLKLFPTTHRQNLIAKLSFISPKAFPLRSSSKPRKLPPLQALPPPPPNSGPSQICFRHYLSFHYLCFNLKPLFFSRLFINRLLRPLHKHTSRISLRLRLAYSGRASPHHAPLRLLPNGLRVRSRDKCWNFHETEPSPYNGSQRCHSTA